jgi:hypothetical protein
VGLGLLVGVALVQGPGAGAQTAPAAPAGDSLLALAPYLAQIVRLAALDPQRAAALVPDAWIDSLLAGAFRLHAEEPSVPDQPDPPKAWPIGPWASPAELVQTLEATDPASVAALYRATSPRIEGRCRARGATPAACDAALRGAGVRIAAREVLLRAKGEGAPAVTPTQRELARLGVAAVTSLRGRVQGVGGRLWGAAWRGAGAG